MRAGMNDGRTAVPREAGKVGGLQPRWRRDRLSSESGSTVEKMDRNPEHHRGGQQNSGRSLISATRWERVGFRVPRGKPGDSNRTNQSLNHANSTHTRAHLSTSCSLPPLGLPQPPAARGVGVLVTPKHPRSLFKLSPPQQLTRELGSETRARAFSEHFIQEVLKCIIPHTVENP